MRDFFPTDRIEHLQDYYLSRVKNSWFLDALCVFESHRRLGVGERLISLTKEKAVENNYNTLSLVVFADNVLAIPVYERTGFAVVQKVELGGNEYIKHADGCLLMKSEITT
jgi:ribosomal protein S18 acetylase RimI-like enzyme